jgi:hypothetical protein
MLTIYTERQINANPDRGNHWVLITKDGEVFQHRNYCGISNTEMHETTIWLKSQFRVEDGYQVDWH